jgi:hypothetical protein
LDAPGGRDKRRSERVKLSVPVVVMTQTADHRQVQEVTATITVNAHGGLFKLKMEVLAGQPMLLLNMNTNQEESCRVVRVELLPNAEYGVAFEFDIPSPQFWLASSAPADWKLVPS